MKILYLTYDITVNGGVERVLQIKTDYFIKNYGYDISILSQKEENKNRFYSFNEKINFYNFNITEKNFLKKQFMKFYYFLKLKEFIKKEKFDIIISTGQFILDPFLPLLKKEAIIIREYHISKKYTQEIRKNNLIKSKIFDFFNEKIIFPQLDKFVTLTYEDKKEWRLKNIEVIYNPLVFYPEKTSTLKNKKAIAVGRLDRQKGFDILIDVWKIVTKENPDWILEIYGEGNERENLQKKIEIFKLEKSIILKGAEKNIEKKYQESSIFILSSRYEGFGMVLIEAMACGLPVVSFNCPCGPKDIIKDNEDGFLIEFGQIDKMAEKINILIKNDNIRKEFGINARKNIEKFSQKIIMNKWKELFLKLLKERNNEKK